MARKIEFDYSHAIDRATRVFWEKGYTNASLRDLLAAMGIGEGSFYNTVKSKKHLYLECLKYYNDIVSRRRLAALHSGNSAREGVRAFFKVVFDDLDDPQTPRVCLLAGSFSEEVLADLGLKQYVVDEMTAFTESFVQRFESAKAMRELASDFNSEVAAQILVTYLQGLFRVIRVLQERDQVERQVETLLGGIGL